MLLPLMGAVVGYSESNNGNLTLDILPCIVCGHSSQIIVPLKSYIEWIEGPIQDAFKDWTPDRREVLMTGIHPDCFETLKEE